MLRFGGFKATFNLKSRKKRSVENENIGEPICGAYRINREEFISSNVDPSKRNTAPIVQMTYTQPTLKNSKSSNDIINDTNPTNQTNVRQSNPDIAQPKPVPRINKNEREKKMLEKQQLAEQKKRELAEQKKREKLALQEQQRQEKVKREREKQQKLEQAKSDKNKPKKRAAPQPKVIQPAATTPRVIQPAATAPGVIQTAATAPKVIQTAATAHKSNSRAPTNYSTNTLESSISRSSGPPPYTEESTLIQNQKDDTGNTSFSTPPEDLGSWDIISQHREQLNRSKATSGSSKQTHMDLHYNKIDSRNKDNSEA